MIRVIPTLFAFALATSLAAQPEPCGPNGAMTSTCLPACIICDIDGFTGINNSTVQGQAPPGFCTTEIHHMQWIGFIAGTPNLTIEVSVFNCQFDEGLEIGIYQSLNCQTFQLVSNCDTDVQDGETGVFTNTVPLTVGQYYYFVMDGSQNDVCNYTVNVTSGSTAVPPLPGSGDILGSATACQGVPSSFTLQAPSGAAHIEWTLDGDYLDQGPSVEVGWPVTGSFELCAVASNACDIAAPTCRTITVYPSPTTNVAATLCQGDCFDVADTTLCAPGLYDLVLPTVHGCDSTIHVVLTGLPAATTDLALVLCDGDSIVIGNQAYAQSGQYQQILPSVNGCDSTVNLALQIIQCVIQGSLSATPAPCHGTAAGSLSVTVSNGTPPFTFSWQGLGAGLPAGTGALPALDAAQSVPDLPAGLYGVTVSDGFGNSAAFATNVGQAPALATTLQASVYQGYNVSCPGATDGTLSLTAAGGTPPYAVQWNTGAATTALQDLGAGSYTATVTDGNGCTLTATTALTEAEPLVLSAAFTDPGCDGPNTGRAEALSTSGGAPPYVYALSGSPFGTDKSYTGLEPGPQSMTVRDANGCETTVADTLATPLIPTVELGPDRTIDLADNLVLQPATPALPLTYAWSADASLSCLDCENPLATPTKTTTYFLTVTAPGGCTATDRVTINVELNRRVYVPNSFSPNDDGVNDWFTVFGGPEVRRVKHLQVFSRWGELIYASDDFEPNYEPRGWDGRFRGKVLEPAVFAWVAEVEFFDGFTAKYKGDLLLVR